MTENRVDGGSLVGILLPVVAVLALAGGIAFFASGAREVPAHSAPAEVPLAQLTNSLGMQFVQIPAGRFLMGSDAEGYGPEHEVQVPAFYLGVHEVTQAQWQAVMGYNPSAFPDPSRPVEQVSWLDVQAFLEELNRREGTNRYRLPSEAEWEYAARAGGTGRFFFGDDVASLRRFAWFGVGEHRGTRSVGTLRPNPWGLYDVYGNVWEWVQDCWHDNYTGAPADGRVWGGAECQLRGLRGGGWNNQSAQLGSAVRGSYDVRFGDRSNGFRVALAP